MVSASAEERQAIEQELARVADAEPYPAGLARARILTEHRLWYDAIGAYTALIARYPDRVEVYEERGAIYDQLEVSKRLAQQDIDRAKKTREEISVPK